MSTSRFDDLSDVYEAMIDWPKRLAGDGPFFRAMFEQSGVRSLADIACGTGHHAAMFHSWGLDVVGTDLSSKMIAQAQAKFGTPDGLIWRVQGFEHPVPHDEPLDAVVCLGNSLALAPSHDVAQQAITQMVAALRPGGRIVLQVLNPWRLADGPCLWQKCVRVDLPAGESLVTKGVQRVGARAFVHLMVAPLDRPADFQSESVPLLSFEADQLSRYAESAGAVDVRLFGNHQHAGFDRSSSVDLILVAQKRHPK